VANQTQAELFARLQAAGVNPYAQGVSQADAELYARLSAAASTTNGQAFHNQTLAEEYAALSAASPLVLDQLSALPAAAYSLRLLTGSYTGKCINVRRDSDNAAMDIGFVGNQIDVATLLAFVGSANGYATAWYNQGSLGSSGNLTQSTAAFQPRVVASGVVEKQVGTSALNFGYTAPCYFDWPSAATPSGTQPFAINIVAKYAYNASNVNILAFGSNPYAGVEFGSPSGNIQVWTGTDHYDTGSTVGTSSPFIVTTAFNGATATTSVRGNVVSTLAASPSLTAVATRLGQGISSAYWSGTICEVVVPLTALATSDRADLEQNQELYFNIAGV